MWLSFTEHLGVHTSRTPQSSPVVPNLHGLLYQSAIQWQHWDPPHWWNASVRWPTLCPCQTFQLSSKLHCYYYTMSSLCMAFSIKRVADIVSRSQFNSAWWRYFCSLLGATTNLFTGLYPKLSGQSECKNQEVEMALSCLVSKPIFLVPTTVIDKVSL